MADTTAEFGAEGGILKVDRLGRVRTPPGRREALLEKYEKSGLSAKAFSAHYGIKYQTFCWWRHRRRRSPSKKAGAAKAPRERRKRSGQCLTLALAELPRPGETAGGACEGLEIKLAGGHRLFVRERREVALAAELIRQLAKAPC